MQYAFEMDIARQYGVNEAVFVHRLYWWVRDNAANNRNYRDGYYWTYDSVDALTKIFPCWTRRQLQGIISKCREKGLIITAEYNSDRRDRTTWYTVTDIVINIYCPERGNAMHETGQCIAPNGAPHSTKRGTLYKEQLEDHLEDEREGDPRPPELPSDEMPDPQTMARSYGEFENVLLTDHEISKLLARWTQKQILSSIENLSVYMKSKNKRYADHYATLLNWLKKDFPEGINQAGRVLIDDDD